MALTLGNIGIIIAVLILGIIIAIGLGIYNSAWGLPIGIIAGDVALCVILVFVFNWYHTSTASGIREMKDFHSEMQNGINREITITAEDGREIFHYEGKIDIETSHENSENYILFESEEGERYIIYYGVQDTVLIVEKAE